MEYTLRRAGQSEAKRADYYFRLNTKKTPDEPISDGCVFSMGGKSFEYSKGQWWRRIPVKTPKPEFEAGAIYGAFTVPVTGQCFFLIKWPSKVHWSKEVCPAIRRLVKRISGKPASQLDIGTECISMEANADQVTAFEEIKGSAKYVYDEASRDFVMVHPGLPPVKSDTIQEDSRCPKTG